MKKLKYNILVIGVLGFSFFSCSDSFLDVKPYTNVLDQNFYKTVDDAEMALVGCYDGYQRTSSNGNLSFYVTSEVLSDNCFGGTGNTDDRKYQALDRFDISQSPSNNNMFNGTWEDYYAGIFRCNTLLQKIDNVQWGDGNEAAKKRIEGETHFLRAIMYFDLVRLFENVPLLLTPTQDNVSQEDPQNMYKLIVEDLLFAAANISYPAYSTSWAADNDGRATQWAAKAMLGRVYLFATGYYGASYLDGVVTKAEVLDGLEDVIDHGGFGLVGSFEGLFEPSAAVPDEDNNTLDLSAYSGDGNKEAIFTQKFNTTQDYNGNLDGNAWLVMMGMRNTSFAPYGRGWGACTVNPKLVNAFSSADERLVSSLIDIKNEGIEDSYDLATQREYTGYSVKKYTPMALPDGTDYVAGMGEGSFQISQYQNYVVMRYADVLLMAAELGSANAQDYFDQVRGRAGLGEVAISQTAIMKERRLEFAFEGIRYWDLLRQGLDVAAATIAESNVSVLSGNAADEVTISADKIKETRGFMQIPNTQITLSGGVLKQNQGW
ncbi:RagB/SusD family nutrient uptake outer membrane protein [uncultured Bacteroides sp.]|uniref:RagB/SusD family nutrient uptake outer membrane protein n=1 Tax=uncultured Bacteroides sp. TaxID=162156 RepID=UPI002AAB9577|nr:RagB/SusD family nutrient uptake outer membrane protein [uncultured Bacteroides sp.]